MSAALTHGQILGGIVTVPNLDASLADYQGRLGLRLVEHGLVPADLAISWGCPGVTGARMATLQPTSGAYCFIRLVEQGVPDSFKPTTTFGWGAFEITVQDVMNWPAKLDGSGFRVIGPPKEIPSMPYFVAMQMLGRGEEMLYLNETRMSMANTDMPFARSSVDHIFIAILATPDRAATTAWYRDRLKLDEADTYTIDYTMINKAFGLPAGTQSSLTMIQKGRMPILEIDDYPPEATPRPTQAGMLPPGNALLTVAIDDFGEINIDWIRPPEARHGPLYGKRRVGTVIGCAGELLELVEVGGAKGSVSPH
jgi:catechol 2,3-dioxygenase-like lactoylglutathione lyase family enzyme